MSERVTKSLKIDPDIWKKVKVYCAQKETDISEYIEELIKKDMKGR